VKIKRQEIELMAPVGSHESLMAAIQGGADAIYFGTMKLNMRARSSNNFNLRDLHKIVKLCHHHGLKTYLTVNSVLYDHELPLMRKVVLSAKKYGVDAIIASDMAAVHFARSIGMDVHMSTQVNITNIESLRYYASFSDVMVLARELNLQQVKEISKAIRKQRIVGPAGKLVRLEMFCHGALCMAVSGKCYLSLHEMNASANRGECMQICRRSYLVTDKETGDELEVDNEFIMSPKDLCTIGFLDTLLGAGITVLKIEGRARSPEYVKTVTQCYREAIDAIVAGTYSQDNITDWTTRLSTVFNRGFWDGYYLGQRLGEWSGKYGSKATTRKVYVGKGSNYFSKLRVAEFLMESRSLSVGDKILITGPTTGVIESEVKEIRFNLENVQKVKKGDRFSIPIDHVVRRSDKLYKVVEVKP
jgi:U32 family peptidase